MVLPVLKLGTLALKTLSKPLAAKLKQQASIHPRFRQFIVNIAQLNHRVTTRMQRRIHSHATDVEIRPLNEEKAVQAAVDLIGEIFIFTVAGAAVIFEVHRSSRSEARKEEIRKKDLEELRERDDNLTREVELLRQKLEELEQLAKARGLSGIFNFKYGNAEDAKLAKPN
ncbi:hypothetical protein LWI29_030586 [Acer saccharum]|uniref:OPA3-like protein n=1 Tax=Acer saccharum TaxID=4024 RepID=A0AA39RSV3_ACESA|nr:hypothetical protein LWI29_030586 [Acer saccharum]KAK1556397.1 hypothetical protein Q3G72_004318 [Acer saccharum]